MGKLTREAQSRERLRKQNRRTAIGVASSIGLLATAIGSYMAFSGDTKAAKKPTVPVEVLDGFEDYIAEYGCADKDKIVFEFGAVEQTDSDTFLLAHTVGNLVTISSEVTDPQSLRTIGVHDGGHACTGVPVVYPVPFTGEVLGGTLVGSDGFQLQYENNLYAAEVEEGVIEWLSIGVENYPVATDPAYIASSQLTDEIARLRGFDRQTIADLHQASDLVGLIALIKNKAVADVNAADIADIALLYQGAFYQGFIPPTEELLFYLNFPNT